MGRGLKVLKMDSVSGLLAERLIRLTNPKHLIYFKFLLHLGSLLRQYESL